MSVTPYFKQIDRTIKHMPRCAECKYARKSNSCHIYTGTYHLRPTAGCVNGKRI